MRLAFPVKVFLSYLLIVFVGTLPTYLFLEKRFQRSWFAHETKRVALQTQKLATFLSPKSRQHRLVELQIMAQTLNERVTYLNAHGVVLYDSAYSDFRGLGNLLGRQEILRLQGKVLSRESFDPKMEGVGVSRRFSKTLKSDMLYVAIRLQPTLGSRSDILRLAMPVKSVQHLLDNLIRVFRNSLAAALSVALFLSLLAAVVFMRPLQRILRAARALASGDYMVSIGKMSGDEVGDVGRAFEELAIDLRKRLAVAGAGETLLIQLIRLIPTGLVLFDEQFRVIGLNRSALRLFETRRESAEENLARWSGTDDYQEALKRADNTGDGQKVSISLPEDERTITGALHAVKHPTSEPFGVFLVNQTELRPSHLPLSSDVVVLPLSTLVERAMLRIHAMVEFEQKTLQQPAEWPHVMVAEARGRVGLALTLLIEGAFLHRSQPDKLVLNYDETEGYVVIVMESRIASFVAALVELCVEPLGGLLQREAGECQLVIPKA